MSQPPAHSPATRYSPAAMTRLVTILLVLMLGALAMLAAHHAQTAQAETSHAVLAEYDTSPQPLADNGGTTDTAGEGLVVGLVTGCIVLIACCALGLALAARVWRADLFRQLGSVATALRTLIRANPTALTPAACPSLVALSISRTIGTYRH